MCSTCITLFQDFEHLTVIILLLIDFCSHVILISMAFLGGLAFGEQPKLFLASGS